MNNYKYEVQSGRSMIEMLGVLAIIGVLSVGGIAGYSKAMNKFKTNKVADNVAMIVTNIRTLYAQQKDYNGLNNYSAVQMGVVPDELVSTTDDSKKEQTLINAFLGNVEIKAANAKGLDATSTGTDKAFTVKFSGLSKEACVTLATNDWGSGYSAGFIGMAVAGTNGGALDSGLDSNCTGSAAAKEEKTGDKVTKVGKATTACAGVAMTVVTAATACGCGRASNTCEILWKYY